MPATRPAKADARISASLRATIERIATQHDRTLSEEIRLALTLWTIVAGVALHHEPDVAADLEPATRERRLHEFGGIALALLAEAFPAADPRAVAASLAPEMLPAEPVPSEA